MSVLIVSIILIVLASIAGIMSLKVKSRKAIIEMKEVESQDIVPDTPTGPSTDTESDETPVDSEESEIPQTPPSSLGGSLRNLFRG